MRYWQFLFMFLNSFFQFGKFINWNRYRFRLVILRIMKENKKQITWIRISEMTFFSNQIHLRNYIMIVYDGLWRMLWHSNANGNEQSPFCVHTLIYTINDLLSLFLIPYHISSFIIHIWMWIQNCVFLNTFISDIFKCLDIYQMIKVALNVLHFITLKLCFI